MTRDDRSYSENILLQSASTADGNGITGTGDGFDGAQYVEIQKTGTGTCTVTFEGSDDQIVWYAIGYYAVDGQATLTRTASGVSVTAGTFSHNYQLLDLYPAVRARQSATSGTVSVTARFYALPE